MNNYDNLKNASTVVKSAASGTDMSDNEYISSAPNIGSEKVNRKIA